jgi:hypothetical protein
MLVTILVGVVLLAFGIAFCFYGFRAFLILLPIVGFIVGFYVGAQAMQIALNEGFLSSALSIIVGLGAGAIGAFASYVFVIMGLVLVVGILGFGVTAAILELLGLDTGCIASLVGLASAIAAVWLSFRYQLFRYLVIISTALLGASNIVLAVLLIFNQITLEQFTSPNGTISPIIRESPIYILLMVALFGAGIYIQVIASRNFNFEDIKIFERWSATNR